MVAKGISMFGSVRLRLEILHEAAINRLIECRIDARQRGLDTSLAPTGETLLALRLLDLREEQAKRRIDRIEAMCRSLSG